ncbi:MAG: DUF4835 family protein [Bacteroidales bacterium]|nr:DUF4835 family protein [Bacteroidales bacterium]
MMKKNCVLIGLCCWFLTSFAQEFNCRVAVNAQKLTGEYASQVNKDLFKTLEQGITAFINDRKWTEYSFSNEEKIDCSLQFVIESADAPNSFSGKMYIQMSRPVFNSTYYSPVFAFQDNDISFKYSENQMFEYDESSYLWTVTSLVAFYANFMLAITFDTYGNRGGDAFYTKCANIVATVPNGEAGWETNSKNSRNRYWLLESYTNSANMPFRTFLYQYHRLGLDLMAKDLNAGYEGVLGSLQLLKDLYKQRTNIYAINILGMYKADELVNMFSVASDEQKQRAADILKAIDPSNMEKYSQIK